MRWIVVATGLALSAGAGFGQIIEEDLKLFPDDSSNLRGFGSAIDLRNGLAVVGALSGNSQLPNSALVFHVATGEQLLTLLPDDGLDSDNFGRAVALGSGVVAVGASDDDDAAPGAGAVYLFDAETGAQIAQLYADDPQTGDRFGASIAIADGLLVVGADQKQIDGVTTGAAYVFDIQSRKLLRRLLAEDGQAADGFGVSVDIDAGRVAIGARFADDQGDASGSAYLFDAATGEQIAKLLAADGVEADRFGSAVAIGNGVIAVGAPDHDAFALGAGAVYAYDVETGEFLNKLVPNDAVQPGSFGQSLSISESVLAVGVQSRENGTNAGAVMLYSTRAFEYLYKLVATDGERFDALGVHIALADGVLVATANGDDDNGMNAGAVYVVDVPPTELGCLRYPGASLGAGFSPRDVAIGDLDRDGNPDLVSANSSTDDVSVLMNLGKGAFDTAIGYDAGNGPIAIELADLDGDGDLDAVVANNFADEVAVLLNDGAGVLALDASYAAGDGPVELAVADFNGDQAPDVAVAATNSDDVSVLINLGNGSFQPAVLYPAGNFTAGVATGDLDGDEVVDMVAVSRISAEVLVFMGAGDGTFTAPVSLAAGSGPATVAIGDVTGDTTPDLVVGNFFSRDVSVLTGNGDGAFGDAVSYPAGVGPSRITLADPDEDGDLDVAVSNPGGGVRMLFNEGDGVFLWDVIYLGGDSPQGFAFADLDCDGDLDIAAANQGSNDVSVLFNQCGVGCRSDWDCNGSVNAADVGAFLSDYFRDVLNGTLVADFDENGVVNPADVGAFLSVYFPEASSPDCV